MNDQAKTKKELLDELTELRLRVAELEKAEEDYTLAVRDVQAREELFREITESSQDMLYRQDFHTGIFEYVSPAVERVLGYTPEQLIEIKLEEQAKAIHPDDLPGLIHFRDDLAQAHALGENFIEREFQIRHKQGHYRWVHGNYQLTMDVEGVPHFIVGALRDITDRKQAEMALRESEHNYRQLMRHTTDVIWTMDMEWNFTYVSPSIKKMFGYTVEQALTNNFKDIMPPESLQTILNGTQEVVTNVDEVGIVSNPLSFDVQQYRSDGSLFWTEVKISLIKKPQDGSLYFQGITRDITDRKVAEEALRDSEERFRLLVKNSNDMIVVIDETGKEKLISESVESSVGYTVAEVLGTSGFNHLHPDDLGQMAETLDWLIGHPGESKRNEYRHRHKDGSWINMEAIGTNLLQDPIINGIVLNVRDITERKKAERALRESEERFRYLADASLDAIFINHKGVCLEANRAAADMFGYEDVEQLVGIFGTDVIAPEYHQTVMDHILSDSAEPYEVMGLRKDGSKFSAAIRTKSMPYKDHEEVRVTTIQDVSFHKEQERRFQIIAEASSDIIYEYDTVNDELIWLGDVESKLGYKKGEILNSINGWMQLIHPHDRSKLYEAVGLHRQSTEPIHYEFRVRRKDGAWRWWAANGYPIVCSEVSSRKWIGACSDITDQKNMEEQLRQSQKMEAIGRLAGGVAHDFNNLLTGINGYAEMIVNSLEEEDPLREDMKEILSAGERAAGLTDQLLAFSRKQIITPKIIHPNKVLDNSQKMLRRIIGEDVDLEFIPDKNLGLISADPAQLDQVLVNLAVNARDALGGGGKLTIETQNVTIDEELCSLHSEAKPGDYVLLAVTDTGHGMDEETLQKIFEPFFSTKSRDQGTGLGLATVYGIVRQNNGFITVYSELKVGTTFKVYYPRVTESPQTLTGVILDELPRGTETILLVEDEDMVRVLAKKALIHHGYQVVEAPSGGDALLAYETHKDEIHLLLTDVIMPDMNGRELSDKLLEGNPALKTLFISGYTENVIAHHGVLNEDVNFMQKPFTIEALVRKVRQVLDFQ